MSMNLDEILEERGKRYGKFSDHAEATQQLKTVIRIYLRRQPVGFTDSDHREALDMICHKIGRILCGDPNYADNWLDLAGYSMLVAKRLQGEDGE
jgi:hypothetical protein